MILKTVVDYEESTGHIASRFTTQNVKWAEPLASGLRRLIIEGPVGTENQKVENGKLVARNKNEEPATWAQIEHWRNTHEMAPVETSQGWFHADPLSISERMGGSIEQFESLPTLNADGTLTWKQPGQTYVDLTKAQLIQAYDEIKTNRAVRSSLLRVQASVFYQMNPSPSVNQLKDMTFWFS